MALVKLNIKEQINCIKEGFSLKRSDQYTLIIELGNDYFSYLITDPQQNELLVLQSYTFSTYSKQDILHCLHELEGKLEFFKYSFKNILISYTSTSSTLVPTSLFKSSEKETYLKFNHPLDTDELVLVDDVKAADAKNVYAVPDKIKQFFDSHFPNHRLRHFTSVYIDTVFSLNLIKKERKCFVNINASRLDVIITGEGLKFCNSFQYQSTEDLIYFILLSLEQNQCDVQQTEIVISGEVESGSGIHRVIQQYVRSVNFAVNDKRIIRSANFSAIPHHYYFNLINRLFCV